MLHSLYLFISIHSYFFVYSSFSQIYTGNNNYGCRIKLEIIHSTTRFCYLYIFLIADPSPTIIYRFASKFLTHALIFKIIGSRAILFWMQSYKSRISIILYLSQELSCYLFKKINKTSTNSVQKIVKIVYDLHRIAIGILLRISISWKKKKRKEKGGGKILRKNISNFNQFPIPRTAQLNHSFTTIQKLSKSSPNQYQDTCVVSHSRIEASSRSNFLETKIYNFPHTHTHTHTATKECTRHQKVAQLSRSVIAPFALSTPLPRFISPRDCDLRPRTPLPFCFSLPLNPEPTIFIAFHRSFVSILDRSIDSYDICLPVQMLRRIFTRREPNSFCGIILFRFLSFDEIVATFFHRMENGRSLGKLLEIFREEINWKIVSGSSSFVKNLQQISLSSVSTQTKTLEKRIIFSVEYRFNEWKHHEKSHSK